MTRFVWSPYTKLEPDFLAEISGRAVPQDSNGKRVDIHLMINSGSYARIEILPT
jgi:hypothetical protein